MVECVWRPSNGVEESVTSSLCEEDEPVSRRVCNDSMCQAQWLEGEWGEVGEGERA